MKFPRAHWRLGKYLCALSANSLAALISSGVVFTCALSANGYVLEGKSWPPGSVVTFQMGLGSAGRTLSDGNTSWDAAAGPGVDAWDSVVAQVQFRVNTGVSSAAASGDRVNSVIFSSTLAVTYWRSSGSQMVEADILFNSNQSFDSYRGVLRFGSNGKAIGDIRRVFTHELGHALGWITPINMVNMWMRL